MTGVGTRAWTTWELAAQDARADLEGMLDAIARVRHKRSPGRGTHAASTSPSPA